MEIELWNVTKFNLIPAIIELFFIFLIIYTFLQTKRGWKAVTVFGILFTPFYAFTAAWLYMEGYFYSPFIGQMILHGGTALIFAFIAYRFIVRDFRKTYIISSIAVFLFQVMSNMAFIVSLGKIFTLSEQQDMIFYTLIEYVVTPIVIVLVLIFIWKRRMPEKVAKFIEYRRARKKLIAAAVILPILVQLIDIFVEYFSDFMSFTATLLSYILFLGFMVLLDYISSREILVEQSRIKEAMLKQQEAYVKNLEEIQQEVRNYRHDFGNIMAGVNLQLQEGNLEEVKDFLEDVTGRFNQKVGESIRQTTQISNIQILTLKSLLLSKMMEMQERGIRCNLEVLYPVKKVSMGLEDLNRCLGILIDNAIEESEQLEEPAVDIILSQQENILSVIVGNQTKNKVALQEVWKSGYSTKGKNRGLGLHSYKKILEKYPVAIPSTRWKDEYFTQELKIMGS